MGVQALHSMSFAISYRESWSEENCFAIAFSVFSCTVHVRSFPMFTEEAVRGPMILKGSCCLNFEFYCVPNMVEEVALL